MKHLFLEQRSSQGSEENEIAVSFKGPRTGLASILASAGSGGAAEYLSSDSIIAIYASTREPQQLSRNGRYTGAMTVKIDPDRWCAFFPRRNAPVTPKTSRARIQLS